MSTPVTYTSDEGTEEEEEQDSYLELDESSKAFIDGLIERILLFTEELSGVTLYPYQRQLGARVIESLLLNDGEEITGLMARQGGKTEVLTDVIAALMVLLPRLAAAYPRLLDKFKDGLWVGVFAPVEEQAETLFGRIVDRLTSETAQGILADDEINDSVKTPGGKMIRLPRSGSLCRRQTANPKAKIESKSYHLIVVDEAQGADEYVISKSVQPMGAAYNASLVKIGTPERVKGDFWRAIQNNKRRHAAGKKQNHFEFDWRVVARYNPNYARYIRKEMIRLGEDSDAFRLSYALEWLLDRGMFVSDHDMDRLADRGMDIVPQWSHSACVAGIDAARKTDSTVVTVVYVDWDQPDEFGYYDHRILDWLELHGEEWETQYFQIVEFLSSYNLLGIGVDGNGMGGPVAERLQRLIPRCEVTKLESDQVNQAARWTHLLQLIQRGKVGWPGSARARRLRKWKRFNQQMRDLEKVYRGRYLTAAAPEEANAHDDYPDSLSCACALTKDLILPQVEVTNSPFIQRRR